MTPRLLGSGWPLFVLSVAAVSVDLTQVDPSDRTGLSARHLSGVSALAALFFGLFLLFFFLQDEEHKFLLLLFCQGHILNLFSEYFSLFLVALVPVAAD